MVTSVLSKYGKRLSQLVAMPSVLGDGLLERARSTGFALLGLTAAVCLGLVAFISHQGWPDILGGPIPRPPAEHQAVHERTIAAGPMTFRGSFVHLHGANATGASTRQHDSGSTPVGSHLAGSHEVATSPALAGDRPAGHGAPGTQPVQQPPAAPTTPAPVPATAPTVASSPSIADQAGGSHNAGGKGKGKEHAQSGSPGKDQGSAAKATSPHEPAAPPVKAEPPAPVEAGSPGKDEPVPPASDKASNPGHGHGYGHYGK
jgi:hypothetical protein